jgi:hypothetical protein
MDEIEERALAQLGMIEQVYSVKIKNKDEAARFIARKAGSKRQVLAICTSLNAWIAGNNAVGDMTIPLNVLADLANLAQ